MSKDMLLRSILGRFWLELTDPRIEEDEKARQEYMTRVIYALFSAALLVTTVVVLGIAYSVEDPFHEPAWIMLSMNVIVFLGWVLIFRNHWRVSGSLLPAIFLVYSGYMVVTRGLITSAVLQLAMAIILAGMLSGNRARWIMVLISLTVYLGGGWVSGERDHETFLMAAILVTVSLVGIALLESFFSNFLNGSLRIAYKREAELRSIFRAAPIGIGLVVDRVILMANDMLCHMTGYAREDLVGHSSRMLYPTQADYDYVGVEKYRQIQEKEVGTVETRWLRKDGEVRDILLSSVPLVPGDLSKGVTFSALDITERKQAEARQTFLLKEKEILLAEVHHRVKNNLQIVTSLLSLQAEEVKDDCTLKLLEESRARIQSMALVHEQLYLAGEYSQIDFGKYIDQLVTTLFNIYQIEPDRVKMEIDSDHQYLSLEKAIPCGLLLNELVTNSLKYAFPKRRGNLLIRMKRQFEKVILTVSDDGIGIPESFEPGSAHSLGLQLVNMLASHDLQGSIALERKNGTHFHIEFPA